MKNKTNLTTDTNNLYNLFFSGTIKALKSVNCRSYSPMLTDLINKYGNDKKALNSVNCAVELAEVSEELEHINKQLSETNKSRKRITTSDEDRATLDEVATALDLKKHQLQDDKKTLSSNDITEVVFSDLMDCIQEYAKAYFLPLEEKHITKAESRYIEVIEGKAKIHTEKKDVNIISNASDSAMFFIESDEDLQQEIIEELARLYQSRSAVVKYIRSNKAPQIYEGTQTVYITPTEQQLIDIKNGKIALDEPIRTSDTEQITFVEKNGNITIKKQYKTVKNCFSLEQYINENGEYFVDSYIKSYNMYADTIGALERIESLCTFAQFTTRERLFLKYFCNKSALVTETKAHIEYFNEHYNTAVKRRALKEFNKNALEYAYKSRLQYCFESIGIKNEATQRQFIKRLKDRAQAYQEQHASINTESFSQDDFRYYNYLMTTNRGIRPSTTATEKDLLSFIDLKAKHTPSTDNGTIWSTTKQEHKPITESDRAQEQAQEQTERERRKIYGYKLELYKALRNAEPMKESTDTNGKKTYNAKYSAFVFFDALTESEQIEVATARLEELKAYEERKKALEKKKTTFEEWRKLNRA